MKALVLMLALTFAWGGSAMAAAPKEPAKRKKLDSFLTDTVSTEGLAPSVSPIEAPGKKARASLIDVRNDFVPELMRSAE